MLLSTVKEEMNRTKAECDRHVPRECQTSAMTHALDDADPLAPLRERFVGTDSPLVYLDGNSLGRPLTVTARAAAAPSSRTSGAAG